MKMVNKDSLIEHNKRYDSNDIFEIENREHEENNSDGFKYLYQDIKIIIYIKLLINLFI